MADAALWYEARNPGLGTEFLRAADGCISSVVRKPELYAELYRGVRRALFRRFPYGLFFLVSGDCITIIACLHGKQDLDRLRQRR